MGTFQIFINSHDDGSPQNTTPPLVRGLPINAAEGLAQALNENGYLREGLVALVASDEPSGEAL
jgi:hypothetical protein